MKIKEINREGFILESTYFYCYSKPLKDYLLENDLRYILTATHNKTHKHYWVFESCEKIDILLTKWRYRKH